MNTLSTKTNRDKYRSASLDEALRVGLVSEAIFEVDRGDAKTIQSPYQSTPTVVVQGLAGTYTPAAFTTTDDTLTVTDEFIVGEHIFDFEETLSKFDLFSSRQDVTNYAVTQKIDQFVLNVITEEATGAYTTAAGGFSAANVNKIMGDLGEKVMGFADLYKGLFLVIENTDASGFTQAQMANGFSFADAALKNGFMSNYGGIDIYVVRSGTFSDATQGTKTWSNAGHRVFGVKNVATYAAPRGIKFEEKGVSGKTGKELVTFGYIGAKLWAPKAGLIVDITLA